MKLEGNRLWSHPHPSEVILFGTYIISDLHSYPPVSTRVSCRVVIPLFENTSVPHDIERSSWSIVD